MINRYQNEKMKEIWSDRNKFNNWLLVEKYSCEAFSELGLIPKEDVKKINSIATFNIDRISQLEVELRHDVIAFTRAVSETLGEESKWIHFGLTSTDVVDTALGYNLKCANQVIGQRLDSLVEVLKNSAQKYKYTTMMGRTHGIHAELTTFGYKIAVYYEEFKRHQIRFELACSDIQVGKISGAVGTYANVDPFVQDYVCTKLAIKSSKISTQTLQRDRHSFYISVITGIGNSLDKLAIELRHLQRTEVNEVQEGFKKNQKGSSAMPHKKNPISSENISGLSRLLRGYNVTANENVALWHERDISHSSTERVMLEDATSLIEYMLNKMCSILENLVVNKEKMISNIAITSNTFFSQKVLLTLIESGLKREDAYYLVQPLAIDCYSNSIDFKIRVHDELKELLSFEEIESCFDLKYHFNSIDLIFSRLGLE